MIFEGSDHDADRGRRRAIVSTPQFPRDGCADVDSAHEGEVEDLRIHIRHRSHAAVHGHRTAQLAALPLSAGSGQTVFLAAPTPGRGRPAHVLVWLDRKRRHCRVRGGLARYDYLRAVAPTGDRFLLRPAALWPTALAALRIYITNWATFDADFLNSVWVAAAPAFLGAAAITYYVPSRFAERAWTSWLLILPIVVLVVLGNSLLIYFARYHI